MKSLGSPVAEPVIRLSDHLLPEQYDPTFPLEWEQNTAASMRSKSGRRRYSLEALPEVPDTMRTRTYAEPNGYSAARSSERSSQRVAP